MPLVSVHSEFYLHWSAGEIFNLGFEEANGRSTEALNEVRAVSVVSCSTKHEYRQ